MLTNGSLQGFQFVAELLASTGPVLVEAPTYDRPLKILASLAAEVIPVPLDEEVAVGSGASCTRSRPSRTPRDGRCRSTGASGSPSWAKEGLLVLEDDPYGLVRFEGKALPTVFELAGGENVVYSSSFSKTIAPGLRVGYLVLPTALAAEVESAAASAYITPRRSCPRPRSTPSLRRGKLAPNLERVCGLLQARRDAMIAALERQLPRRRGSSRKAAISCGSSSPATCRSRN